MSEVKRYSEGRFSGFGTEHLQGCWVRASDFDRVTAERDAALGREAALQKCISTIELIINSGANQRDALQQRLTAADERADVLEAQLASRESELEEFSIEMTLAISDSQIRSAMTVIGRSRFLQLLQAYNARIDAALKPAEGLDRRDMAAKVHLMKRQGGGDDA